MRLDPHDFWIAGATAVCLMLGAQYARAHSWYPWECCSDKDCEMVAATSIKRDDTSWLLPNGERVPFDAARESPDPDFHWCRYTNGATDPIIKPAGKAPCFFVPKPWM